MTSRSDLAQGFHAIADADYHADPCPSPSLSSSVAKVLLTRTPYHAWCAHPRLNPDHAPVRKPAWDFGTAVHQLVLEPERNDIEVVDAPDWRKKDAQSERDAAYAAGKVPMLVHEYWAAFTVARQLWNAYADHEMLGNIILASQTELAMIWQEPNGVWCRAKADVIDDTRDRIIDIKTTTDATPSVFSRRSYFDYGYHIQEAFYRRGYRAITGRDCDFRFVAVDKDAPHLTATFASAPSVQAYADSLVERAIKTWAECTAADEWPGYDTRTHYVELPAYMLAQMETGE